MIYMCSVISASVVVLICDLQKGVFMEVRMLILADRSKCIHLFKDNRFLPSSNQIGANPVCEMGVHIDFSKGIDPLDYINVALDMVFDGKVRVEFQNEDNFGSLQDFMGEMFITRDSISIYTTKTEEEICELAGVKDILEFNEKAKTNLGQRIVGKPPITRIELDYGGDGA